MLAWLTLIVAALAGLFVYFQHRTGVLDAVSAGFTAAGVIGMLVAMYVGAHKSRGHFEIRHWLAGLIILVFGSALAVWLFAPQLLSGSLDTSSPSPALRAETKGAQRAVSVLLRKGSDGKFTAYGQINGTAADFTVDSGSSTVMLKYSDAEKAGIDAGALAFTTPVQTANGTVYAAPVRLRSVAIGALRVDDLEALVAQPGNLNENLLGISFLRRLASYDVNGEFMTLRE